MSFDKQPDEELAPAVDDSLPPKRVKANWLRGGILTIIFSTANLIYFSQTGKSLISSYGQSKSSHGFEVFMSVAALIFGVIAVFIHFARNLD